MVCEGRLMLKLCVRQPSEFYHNSGEIRHEKTIFLQNDQFCVVDWIETFFFTDLEVLKVERMQLIDAVLNLCTYHHPENIQLPAGYCFHWH